jgi:hypothetical protein
VRPNSVMKRASRRALTDVPRANRGARGKRRCLIRHGFSSSMLYLHTVLNLATNAATVTSVRRVCAAPPGVVVILPGTARAGCASRSILPSAPLDGVVANLPPLTSLRRPDRARGHVRMLHDSLGTEQACLYWCRAFTRFYGLRHWADTRRYTPSNLTLPSASVAAALRVSTPSLT